VDDLTAAIEGLTRRVHAYRVFTKGDLSMALELKGLKGKSIKAAANLDRLNHAYDAFNEAAPAHAADVEGLAEQLGGMAEDLTFATTTLGNSVAASNDGGDQKKPDETKTTTEPALAQQSVTGATFRSEAERQIAAANSKS
jgi:hypothetical protein